MSEKTRILTCWGTIDKDYGEGRGVYDFHIGPPCVGKILQKLGVSDMSYIIQELMREDSLDMEDPERRVVHSAAKISKEKRILGTHGTDSMIETWLCLADIKNKIIFLAGSSRPYSMKITDAEENINFAWRELQKETRNGVYIAMNNRVLPIERAHKAADGSFIDIKYADMSNEDLTYYGKWLHIWNGVLEEV